MSCNRRFYAWAPGMRGSTGPWLAIAAMCGVGVLGVGRLAQMTGSRNVVRAASEGELELTITPNPVVAAADGTWTYRVQIHEVKGGAVRLRKLVIGGTDQTARIDQWLGATEIPANGWALATARTEAAGPSLVEWVLQGESRTWRATVQLK